MTVELAAARACQNLRGELRPLRAEASAAAVGTIWVRECRASVNGSTVAFAIGGATWGTAPHQRSDVSVTARGEMFVSYDAMSKVATVRYVPSGAPQVDVIPDRGNMSRAAPQADAILGALSAAVAGPGRAPVLAVPGANVFTRGLVVRVSMCTGMIEFVLGNAQTLTRFAGSPAVPVELAPATTALFGPQPANGPVDVTLRAERGEAHAALVCQADAERIAASLASGQAPRAVDELASADIRGERQLRVTAPRCPVALVVSNRSHAPARVQWWRPVADVPLATPAPILRCGPP